MAEVVLPSGYVFERATLEKGLELAEREQPPKLEQQMQACPSLRELWGLEVAKNAYGLVRVLAGTRTMRASEVDEILPALLVAASAKLLKPFEELAIPRDEGDCCVCLDAGQRVALPCGHRLHLDCFCEASETARQSRCPICRAPAFRAQ